MSKSIKRLVRDSVLANLETVIGDYVEGVRMVAAFEGVELESMHIRVATPSAIPTVTGGSNLRRWTVTATVSAVTQIDKADNDQHDNLAGLIEAYCLQNKATLTAALTNTELQVQDVTPGNSQEMAVGGMRYSSQELMVECLML